MTEIIFLPLIFGMLILILVVMLLGRTAVWGLVGLGVLWYTWGHISTPPNLWYVPDRAATATEEARAEAESDRDYWQQSPPVLKLGSWDLPSLPSPRPVR